MSLLINIVAFRHSRASLAGGSALQGLARPMQLRSRMNRTRILTAAFALTATAAGALDLDQVQIAYELKVGAHQISGVSHALEWQALALDGERAQVRLRVPIDSFDSGHAEFDSALRKALDAEYHPFAQLEGIARDGRLDGTIELKGVVRPILVRLHVERLEGHLIAVASFGVDLREHGIVLENVDPHLSVEAVVRLTTSTNAVLAGGFTRTANAW